MATPVEQRAWPVYQKGLLQWAKGCRDAVIVDFQEVLRDDEKAAWVRSQAASIAEVLRRHAVLRQLSLVDGAGPALEGLEKVPDENALTKALIDCGLQRDTSYMLPSCDDPARMKNPDFQKRLADGPNGVITIFLKNDMGRNLVLTFVYFVVSSACLAYLGTIGLPRGTEFLTVFRFFATAGLLTHLAAATPRRCTTSPSRSVRNVQTRSGTTGLSDQCIA